MSMERTKGGLVQMAATSSASLTCMIRALAMYGGLFSCSTLFNPCQLPGVILSYIALLSGSFMFQRIHSHRHLFFVVNSLNADVWRSSKYPSLGNFPLFVQAGCPGNDLNSCKFTKEDRATPSIDGTVEARPGYFGIFLNTSIHAEMTVTSHTALYRFTFPKTFDSGNGSTPISPLMTIELNDLRRTRSIGAISVVPASGRITGEGQFLPSFGVGEYRLHFCADFSGATIRETGTFNATHAGSEPKDIPHVERWMYAGAYTWLNAPAANDEIIARVGISFISVGQACANAETEVPNWDFEKTMQAAEKPWKTKLAVIQIDAGGVSNSLQTTFWSGIYRSMISPQDYTGENPLWQSTEPYYDSYYWYVTPAPYRVHPHQQLTRLIKHMGLIPHHSPSPYHDRSSNPSPHAKKPSRHLPPRRLPARLSHATLQRLHPRWLQRRHRPRRILP